MYVTNRMYNLSVHVCTHTHTHTHIHTLIQVGQRVGVMRKEGGDMVLFIDGKEVEVVAKKVPSNVYGVVDICSRCVAVKLTSPSVDLNPKHLKQAKDLARQDGVQLKNVETVKSNNTCE